jgi:ABC-type Mn2+/Zn2+ transport system ATPase subunit
MTYLIKTDNLTVGYKINLPILKNIQLELAPGSITAIIGSNGSGKTTLIKTLAGLIKPLYGSIEKSNNFKISMVPQIKNIQLAYPITVEETIKMPIQSDYLFKKYNFSKDDNQILEQLEINDYIHFLLRECSGGQLQKALIARSLISHSTFIILDEPLDALDQNTKSRIFNILTERVSKNNTSILIITHHLHTNWLNRFDKIYQTNEGFLEEL